MPENDPLTGDLTMMTAIYILAAIGFVSRAVKGALLIGRLAARLI